MKRALSRVHVGPSNDDNRGLTTCCPLKNGLMQYKHPSSNYLQNFDWSRTFWKPTNGSHSMHVLCSQGKDGSRGIAFTALVRSKFPMFIVKICITNDDRTRLKTGLKRNGNLGDSWSMSFIEPVIFVSAKPDFVESMINIMQDDSNKAAVMTILEDKTFLFVYDVRNTAPGKFPDPSQFDVSGFRQDNNVAVEMQIYFRKFKSKCGNGPGQGYSFRLVGIYKLEDVQLPPVSTPEKRCQGANEWIATPPRTKKTCAALSPLEWIVGEDNGGDSNTA